MFDNRCDGETLDGGVNATHQTISSLTDDDIVSILKSAKNGVTNTFGVDEIADEIRKGINEGHIDASRMRFSV